ncbi:hypothetical protein ACXR0O_19190 [Verrucomicrobiota bacterium sgz303538]
MKYDPITDAMTPEDREAIARRVFIAPDETHIGAVRLRPVTLGTLAILEETKNEFLFPRGPVKAVPHPETGEVIEMAVPENELFAALAFGYIHSADLSEVRRAAFAPRFFQERVLEFGDQLQPSQLQILIREIGDRLREIQALRFTIAPKPDNSSNDGPTPPPN